MRTYTSKPFVTPAKIFGNKKLPSPCNAAIICFCPMPEQFKYYLPFKSPDRLFLHVHPDQVNFCQYKEHHFIVLAEVYGGPVSVSVVEELHHYGISNIIGLGFVGSLTADLPISKNICSGNSLVEQGTCPHYMSTSDCDMIESDDIIEKMFNNKLESCNIWTTNGIYREYEHDIQRAKEFNCRAVNMDTAPLFASCKMLNLSYGYVATVSDVLDEKWTNDLTASIDNGNIAQNKLAQIVIEFIPQMDKLSNDSYGKIEFDVLALVEKLFVQLNICKSHSIDHIKRVLDHTINALVHEQLSLKTKFLIRLASILHDVDDLKFVDTVSYANAKQILTGHVCNEDMDLVIEMISYVSASVNGNTIPNRAKLFPWLLIPRYADRLEAVGIIGVIRCYQYTKTKSSPLFTDKTLKPKVIDDVWNIATEERYAKYNGQSSSMIDHYYDKLLRLGNFETDNPYIKKIQISSLDPLLKVIDLFIADKLTDEYFESLIN
uniref:Nucleoside phosphorylase domain-containing protein n=1 Tax=viral metagenome TaxID=1070528 RepID=A0A6C0C822_9ZZZZ